MRLDEVLDYFGTYYRISKEVGFSMNTPRNWNRIGYIPADAQAKIEKFTNGRFTLSYEDLKHRKTKNGRR